MEARRIVYIYEVHQKNGDSVLVALSAKVAVFRNTNLTTGKHQLGDIKSPKLMEALAAAATELGVENYRSDATDSIELLATAQLTIDETISYDTVKLAA